MAKRTPSLAAVRRRLRDRRTHDVDVLDCTHTDGSVPTLGTVGAGVFCTRCGMLLTWEELAEYMRGEHKED